ncbi:MAG TPA: hypothetical protein VFK59_11060 [Actinomycetota bacterium]|nr:hypothetical protein [Actinomycetota bacterium]
MTDVELLVREALARHEAEIPVTDPLEVRGVAARARRRQVRNLLGAGLLAIAILFGAVSGIGAILRAEDRRPAIHPTPTPSVPSDPQPAPIAFPAAGVAPSEPVLGEPVIAFYSEDVTQASLPAPDHWERLAIEIYADGRMVWSRCAEELETLGAEPDPSVPQGCVPAPGLDDIGVVNTGWVEQRLTPEAVELLRTELLDTGLFKPDWYSVTPNSTNLLDWMFIDVRDGDRIRSVRVDYQSIDFNPPTAHQLAGLEHMQEIFLDLERWFPETAWMQREVTPFVPPSYSFWSKRGPEKALLRDAASGLEIVKLEPADLPAPADRFLTREGCDVVTLDEARAILEGFEAAGITRSTEMSSADIIAFLVLDGEDGAAVYFEPVRSRPPPDCDSP